MKIIIPSIILCYLLIQTVSDIKTLKVYVFLNNIILSFSIFCYFFDCMRANTPIMQPFFPNLCMLCFILSTAFLYGTGDVKALLIIYFTTRYFSNTYPHPDNLLFLITFLFANILFILISFILKIKKGILLKSEKLRLPFFPMLMGSYIIIWIISLYI